MRWNDRDLKYIVALGWTYLNKPDYEFKAPWRL